MARPAPWRREPARASHRRIRPATDHRRTGVARPGSTPRISRRRSAPGNGCPPPRTRAGMACVPVGFVDDVEKLRIERLRQTRDNSFLHGHAFALPFSVSPTLDSGSGVVDRMRFETSGRRARRPGGWGLPGGGGAHKDHEHESEFSSVRSHPGEAGGARAGQGRDQDALQPSGLPGRRRCTAPPRAASARASISSFCKDHVREYNASYDYFRGMDDESMAKFRQADAIGHRPTWKLGRAGGGEPRR